LISAGISTLATAIPAPSTAVPTSSAPTAPATRTSSPAISTPSANWSARSIPIRRAIGAAHIETPANASSGRVVRSPAAAEDKPISARMSPTSGPTAVIGGRRFAAISMHPAITRPGRTA
jgi:hypothetical protein